MWPRLWLRVRPKRTPRARGSFTGVFLPQKIGKQDQPVAPAGNVASRFVQSLVIGIGGQLLPEPPDDAAAGRHAAVQQILAGNHMIIEEKAGIHDQLVERSTGYRPHRRALPAGRRGPSDRPRTPRRHGLRSRRRRVCPDRDPYVARPQP